MTSHRLGAHYSQFQEPEKTPYEICLDWIYEQQGEIEKQGYGTNHQAVTDAIALQEIKTKQIKDYEREVNKVAKRVSEAEAERLHSAYQNLLELAKKKLTCLQTMLDITAMEEYCGNLSSAVDSQAVGMVDLSKKGDTVQKAVGDQVSGFVSPSSQDCIFAAQDNWKWLMKLVQCIDIHLKNAGNYHKFFHEIEESGHWMISDLNRLVEVFESRPLKNDYNDAQWVFEKLKEIATALKQWESKVDRMWDEGVNIVPVYLRTQGVKEATPIRSLCDYQTKDIHIREGEDLLLLDNSKANLWKIRNCRGTEGEVPALACLIPGPFKEAIDASVKMRLMLLAGWTNALKRVGKRLIHFMLLIFQPHYKDNQGMITLLRSIKQMDRQDLLRILDFIQDTLRVHWADHESYIKLEERMTALQMILQEAGEEPLHDENVYRALVVQIAMLEKIMKKYQEMWKDWESYKVALEASQAPELMLIVDKWEQLKYVSRAYFTKYWQSELGFDDMEKSLKSIGMENVTDILDGETGKMENGFDETVVKETIIAPQSANVVSSSKPTQMAAMGETGMESFEEEIIEDTAGFETETVAGTEEDGDFGMATETKTAETEYLQNTEMEETKTMVIKSVVDTRDNSEISMQQAIMLGIMKPSEGVYCNMATGEDVPIPVAMSSGLIKVEFTSTKRTKEKKSSIGLITVKTIREAVQPYTIKTAMDTNRNKKLSLKEAVAAKIIDEKQGTFRDTKRRSDMLISDAIQKDLVVVEYQGEPPEPEVISQTYAVRAVVDTRAKKTVTFSEAVRKGLINKETAAFKDTQTGESMYVGDAIIKGYLKARPVEDTKSLNIDPENQMVVDKTDNIKKRIIRPLGVISAFKKAALFGRKS